jgi:hypothetical protein
MKMGVTHENLSDVIRYHAPSDEQVAAINEIREVAQNMIDAILGLAPVCADQQAAIRKVREAMMTANAAIVLDGMV